MMAAESGGILVQLLWAREMHCVTQLPLVFEIVRVKEEDFSIALLTMVVKEEREP